jgi:plastocyanin
VKRIAIGLTLVLVAASLALISAPAEARRTWTVLAGPWGPRDYSIVSNAFHPRSIEIAVGDTVTWQISGFHSVAFLSGAQPAEPFVREGDNTYLNPRNEFPSGGKTYDGTGFRNSGSPSEFPKPFTYSLTFTKPGTYQYLCLIHGPAMSGTVIVKDRVMTTPAQVARNGRRELAATLKEGRTVWTKYRTERKDGAVVVPLIGDAKAGFSILRFTPQPLVISAGTTVTWTMRDPLEIHTVTFLGGEKRPDFVIVQALKQGPPRLLVNPKVMMPTQATSYNGAGYANSGILFPVGAPPDLPKSFSLTFTKPGRYEYFCIVHMPVEGMRGTIIVK